MYKVDDDWDEPSDSPKGRFATPLRDRMLAARRDVTPEWRRRAERHELPAVDGTARVTDTSIVL